MAKATSTKKSAAPKKAAPKKSTASKSSGASRSAKSSSSEEAPLMELFIDGIKDLYWAEKHLTKALPKMQKGATAPELADAIGEHLEVTKMQVQRLEQVFELLGKKAQAKKCDAMEGLVEEGKSILEETDAGTATRDVGIILASQKIEHYEIASYGGLTQLAKTLGLEEVAGLLGETLAEEKEADELLTGIAENDINIEAAEEDE